MSGTDDGTVWCMGCGHQVDVDVLPRERQEEPVPAADPRRGVLGRYTWQAVRCVHCGVSTRVTLSVWEPSPPQRLQSAPAVSR